MPGLAGILPSQLVQDLKRLGTDVCIRTIRGNIQLLDCALLIASSAQRHGQLAPFKSPRSASNRASALAECGPPVNGLSCHNGISSGRFD